MHIFDLIFPEQVCLFLNIFLEQGPEESVLANLGRGRVQDFDSWTQKYNLWQKSYAKDTQNYKLDTFLSSSFLYGRQHTDNMALKLSI